MAIKNFKSILDKTGYYVSEKDRKIFERGSLPAYFGRGMTDTIEFILYDQGDNILPQGKDGKMVRYVDISNKEAIRRYILIVRPQVSNKPNEYFVDVEKLINEAGYKNVISLPNGANDNDDYWINSEKYLKENEIKLKMLVTTH